jgi:hypothetical protein
MEATKKQNLKELTINLLLALRADLLAAGANALSHWEQLQTRLERACKTADTIDVWFSVLTRSLAIPTPSRSSVGAFNLLSAQTTALECDGDWIAEMQRTVPALIALTRVRAEDRKAAAAARRKEIDDGIATLEQEIEASK